MRLPDDDPEASSTPETETTQTTEESDASAPAAAQPSIPVATLRFLLHKDTPLLRLSH